MRTRRVTARSRRWPRVAGTLVALLAVPVLGAAQSPYEEVADSPHNFSGSTVMREVCAGCHVAAPVPASEEDQLLATTPIWGGGDAGGFFTLGPDAGGADAPDTSARCMECHDGVLAVAVHQQNEQLLAEAHGGNRVPSHPIRIPYPRNTAGLFVVATPLPQNRQFWSVPDIRAGQLTLPTGPTSPYQSALEGDTTTLTFDLVRVRDGQVHCESCHNPHSNRTPPFLRKMPPDLCLVCHDK